MVLAYTDASAMLIFGSPNNPVPQSWPIIGGHTISALIGTSSYILIETPILASSAGIGGIVVHDFGFYFVIVPVFFNSIISLSIAMAVGIFREVNPFTVE